MTAKPSPPTHAALGRFRLSVEPLVGPTQSSGPQSLVPQSLVPQSLVPQWRGAIASMFPDDPAFHGHQGDHTIPRYPEVQYRWVDNGPALFSIGAPTQRLMAHPWPGTPLRIGEEHVTVTGVDWQTFAITQSFSSRLTRYKFCAPWIALNQENYARFRTLSYPKQRAELDRILVGNLLTMSQAFGWYFEPHEVVYAAFEETGEVPCAVKKVQLIGFEGAFVTNLVLPDWLALGRAVSFGYGWFRGV